MYDAGKIIPGLVVFAGLVSFPIWYTAGRGQGGIEPKLKLPAGETQCVESKEFMKSEHMALLDQWRNAVVREGDRVYTATSGKQYEMSLTNTCMSCHDDKVAFCDRCHDYEAVADPYCWSCHVMPEKGAKAAAAAPAPQPVAAVTAGPAADGDAVAAEPADQPTPAAAPAASEGTRELPNKGNE